MHSGDWQRAEELFKQCADLSPRGQREFLQRHCANAPEVRDIVLGLLRGDRSNDTLLDVVGRAANAAVIHDNDRWRDDNWEPIRSNPG